MKRAVIVLLLLIANAVITPGKVKPVPRLRPEVKVAQASSLPSPELCKLEVCPAL